ncbi:ABC transporter permease [Halarcobacter sp.]|uniref:ABC transporter permease n=1 Tax=Halarcobacter sp. TaxID=2321133 RepID=UPI002AA8D5E0|nr:ABC transporter permease [Halarcobacter sp.]
MSNLINRYGKFLSTYILFSVTLWLSIFIIFPQALMVEYSFWKYDETAQQKLWEKTDKLDAKRYELEKKLEENPQDKKIEQQINKLSRQIEKNDLLSQEPPKIYTDENYEYLLTNTLHRSIFFKTIWSSILVTVLAFIVCYPIAYYLAHVASKKGKIFIFLGLIIPYWVDELLRTFAWFMILSFNGIINNILISFGLIETPIDFFQNNSAALIGMVYAYILFMLFPIYNTLETLDKNQILAARDLGASWFTIHKKIIIPYAKPGIAVGSIFVFMLTAGTYAVPSILGGTKGLWFTQIIYSWFFDGGNWNQGSAYGIALLVLCILFIVLMLKLFKVKLEDMSK